MTSGTPMVVVPATFLSQEWVNQLSMKPSQRHFNPVATGQRLYNTLATPDQDVVTKRSKFLDELGAFNEYTTRRKPPAFRLKAKATPKSKTYDNVTLQDLLARAAPAQTGAPPPVAVPLPPPPPPPPLRKEVETLFGLVGTPPRPPQPPPPPTLPPTYSSAMRAPRLHVSPDLLAAASGQLKKTPKPTKRSDPFLDELTKAIKTPRLKATPKKRPVTSYPPAHPIARLLYDADHATPEVESRRSKRTRSKTQKQKGYGAKFQYVSFNKHKRDRRVHIH